MKSKWFRRSAFALSTLFATVPVLAADVAGAKDHPLLTRFNGATISNYNTSEFDEVVLPIKAIESESKVSAGDLLKAEGKVTRIGYVIAANKTALEVMRNYQDALAAGGFKPVFQCAGDDCGRDLAGYVANSGKVMPSGFSALFGDKNRYLLSKKTAAQGDVYVLLYVMEEGGPSKRLLTYEQVVELKPMATGQVKVIDAVGLKKGLDSDGRIALYGIFFDTAKADIKPESKPELDEMFKLLSGTPGLRVYIVGHTDNVGGLAANLDLSQRRAEAVAKALAGYKIDPQRLSAKGVASLAPLSSNADEAGRARNRRVELVLQ